MIVTTTNGPVRGLDLGSVGAWLGMPYAAPPVGDRRFRAPEPVERSSSVFDAVAFGPAAPQPGVGAHADAAPLSRAFLSLLYPHSGSPVGGTLVDEACLVLNVWAPAGVTAAPVMVWLHGGAFMHGAGSEPPFWGDRLAARHGVVVVTVNHRLGALGYLGAGDRDAGQAGMLDIVAALEWVRDNIGAFGGDAGNVTVFGQSGGGMKVSTLLCMPSAEGLFHRAIVMSGAGLHLPGPAEVRPVHDLFYSLVGVAPDDVDALRRVPVDGILAAQQATALAAGSLLAWLPVRDGETIVADPLSSPATSGAGIPMLTGATTEEMGIFLTEDPAYATIDDHALTARLGEGFGPSACAVEDAYRAAFPAADAAGILRRVLSDRDFRVSCRQYADLKAQRSDAPVYSYLFDFDPGVLGGRAGASHSAELAFVFDNADRVPLSGTRPERDAVADAMARAWTTFARTGVPGAEWPPYTADDRRTVVFSASGPHVVSDPDSERLDLMASFPSEVIARA